jgi:hypothetical protein
MRTIRERIAASEAREVDIQRRLVNIEDKLGKLLERYRSVPAARPSSTHSLVSAATVSSFVVGLVEAVRHFAGNTPGGGQ